MQDNEFKVTGATVEEAIKNTLQKFQLQRKDIDVTVIDNGSKGILGFNKRPAKILVKTNFDVPKFVEEFFNKVIHGLHLDADVITKFNGKNFIVELIGNDASFFIGHHGSVLYAFQHILNLALKKYEVPKVFIDAGNYRDERKESLERYAISCAKKVIRTGIKYVFEPMNSYERLIVHTALQNFPGITTYSDGFENNRHVVIDLNRPK